jgi:hypothetical protein
MDMKYGETEVQPLGECYGASDMLVVNLEHVE